MTQHLFKLRRKLPYLVSYSNLKYVVDPCVAVLVLMVVAGPDPVVVSDPSDHLVLLPNDDLIYVVDQEIQELVSIL